MNKVTWLGHSAFKIQDESLSVLVDPFLTKPELAQQAEEGGVDLVLVTHDHGDHVGDSVGICQRTGASLIAIVGTSGKLQAQGIPPKQVLYGGRNMGGTVNFKGIEVTMTQAYHSSESGSPAGYIIRMPDGFTIYHAGDTCIFSGMALWGKLYNINLALLPIGGHYTMDARQAALACGLLKCSSVVPMHWGTFPILAQSTAEFEEALQKTVPSCTSIIMQPGESVSFNK